MNPFFVLSSTRIKIIAIILAVILVLSLVLYYGYRKVGGDPKVTLTMWGVFDDKDAIDALVKEFRNNKPNVTVNYVKISDDTKSYEKQLIDALAAGSGPDIFMIQNTWLPKHQSKIAPLDSKRQTLLNFPYVTFRDSFPKVVSDDFVRDTTIYASPLYLDTLAMFYNRDFFDRKGIAVVPSTWAEFDRIVPLLREINPSTNEIFKAAAAIGGSDASINRATDLLALLMMQRGTEFTDSDGKYAKFAGGSGSDNYGLQGLKYYTNFANSNSSFYTWNERFHYSIDSFAEGNTAIMFNYAYQIPVVKDKNAFLDFRIAPIPQQAGATQPINYANYLGLTVSKQSKNPNVAWDFITFATTNKASAGAYANITNKPPALLTLIDANLNNKDFGVFAKQALTARSWRQIDNSAIELIFSDMISSVVRGELTAEVALKKAEDMVTQLMK